MVLCQIEVQYQKWNEKMIFKGHFKVQFQKHLNNNKHDLAGLSLYAVLKISRYKTNLKGSEARE